MNEDWDLLVSFLPSDWRELAHETGTLKGLRKDKSVEHLMRTLLLHLGCGHSLRETVVRARKANLADLSDVALLKRLKKSKEWLHALCVRLFREHGVAAATHDGFQIRAFDATTVREPGRTGGLWRIHYSVSLPSLACDFFKLTPTEGPGTGESFSHFPIRDGDFIVADRGYSTASGIGHVVNAGGHVIVRVDASALPFRTVRRDRSFDWLGAVTSLERAGTVRSWPVRVDVKDGMAVTGRVCAIRKTEEAIRLAHEKLHRRASRRGTQLQPETLAFARYVIVFTTFPESSFIASEVLEWYRIRWQVEWVFKRFKSLAHLGHLPKYDDESAKAWLYGKLLVALLVEKLIRHAVAVSPLGIQTGGAVNRTARDVTSGSYSTKSHEPLNPPCHWLR